jgi:hypothetical protein
MAELTPGTVVRLEGLGKMKKSNYLIDNRNRDLPVCSVVPQPTTLKHDSPTLDYGEASFLSTPLTLSPARKNMP